MAFGLDDVLGAGLAIINKIIPDPAQRAQMELELIKLKQAGELKDIEVAFALAKGQIDTNIAEASGNSFFQKGWRPYIGWVCGTGLAYQYLAHPFLVWVCLYKGIATPPELNMETLMTLLFGMLGLGVMRTTEKIKSVN